MLVKQGRVELRSKDTFMTKVNRTPTVTDDPCKELPNLYSKQTKPAKLRNAHTQILFKLTSINHSSLKVHIVSFQLETEFSTFIVFKIIVEFEI